MFFWKNPAQKKPEPPAPTDRVHYRIIDDRNSYGWVHRALQFQDVRRCGSPWCLIETGIVAAYDIDKYYHTDGNHSSEQTFEKFIREYPTWEQLLKHEASVLILKKEREEEINRLMNKRSGPPRYFH